jgi:hypothetical protein
VAPCLEGLERGVDGPCPLVVKNTVANAIRCSLKLCQSRSQLYLYSAAGGVLRMRRRRGHSVGVPWLALVCIWCCLELRLAEPDVLLGADAASFARSYTPPSGLGATAPKRAAKSPKREDALHISWRHERPVLAPGPA